MATNGLYVAVDQTDSTSTLQPVPAPSEAEGDMLRGKSAVIVEDEGVTQMQVKRILTRAGLRVVGAAMSGEEAVRVVLQEHPDIVLMDINMPGQFNGLEATRRILEQFPACVVMLTAYEEHRQEAERIGTSGYAVKPIDSRTLIPQLQAAWERFRNR